MLVSVNNVKPNGDPLNGNCLRTTYIVQGEIFVESDERRDDGCAARHY